MSDILKVDTVKSMPPRVGYVISSDVRNIFDPLRSDTLSVSREANGVEIRTQDGRVYMDVQRAENLRDALTDLIANYPGGASV